MRKDRFTEHHIITVIKSVEAGRSVKDVCREAEPPTTSMDYLRYASTESGFELLLTSIRHQ
ncbi:transposase, partial [Escherichia coli]|uniref:transposase n=2 Tax=Escherichia coli TaxID=562 RepID=UPI00202CB74A